MIAATCDGDAAQYTHIRFWRVLVVLWLTYTSYTMVRRPFSIARVDIEKELDISTVKLSFVDTVFICAYTVSQFCYVFLKPRMSFSSILLMGLAGSVASCFILASSSYLAQFIFAWVLNGLAQGMGWVSCIGIINNWVFPAERGTVLGVWSTNMAVGGILGNVIPAWLIGQGYTWRSAVVLSVAVGPLVILIITAMFLKQNPNECGFPSVQQSEAGITYEELMEMPKVGLTMDSEYILPNNRECTEETKKTADIERPHSILSVLALPGVSTYSFSYFINKLVRYSFMFWLPYYLSKELGASVEMSGYVASFFDIGGMLGIVISGYCSDHFFGGKRRMLVLVLFMLGMVVCTVALGAFSSSFAGHMMLCSVIVFLVGFFSFAVDSLQGGTCLLWLCDAIAAPVGPVCGVVGGIGSLGSVIQGVVTVLFASSSWATLFVTFGVATLIAALLIKKHVAMEA